MFYWLPFARAERVVVFVMAIVATAATHTLSKATGIPIHHTNKPTKTHLLPPTNIDCVENKNNVQLLEHNVAAAAAKKKRKNINIRETKTTVKPGS